MLALEPCFGDISIPTILAVGAHSDDLEIGAGATLLGLVRQYPRARIVWVVLCAQGTRAVEARESAARLTAGLADASIQLFGFRDGYFSAQIAEIKACLETLKARLQPDVIFTHYREDRHQDHRTVSDLTWQTFRNHLILEYEIPKYDGDLGSPNTFLPVADEIRAEKLAVLATCLGSQQHREWFTADTFNALMCLRGMECNSPTGYAEAFYCRKLVIRGWMQPES